MTDTGIQNVYLPKQNVLTAFFLFVMIGGGSSVAIRITYAELDPFWVGTARFALGAFAFWIIVLVKKIPFPKGPALIGALIFGVLSVGFAYVFKAWGLVKTPASFYQILTALIPLITLFLSSIHGIEIISQRGIIGALLALAGIAVIVGGAEPSDFSLPHTAAIITGAALMAEGGVLVKKFPSNSPFMTNAIGMSAGAVILAATSLISGEKWSVPTGINTWLAFTYLIVFVTLLAFLLYVFVLNNWTASGTSYGFVLFPLVTVAAASYVAGESITVNFLFGAAFVLAGVLVGAVLPSGEKVSNLEECRDRSGKVLSGCI